MQAGKVIYFFTKNDQDMCFRKGGGERSRFSRNKDSLQSGAGPSTVIYEKWPGERKQPGEIRTLSKEQ